MLNEAPWIGSQTFEWYVGEHVTMTIQLVCYISCIKISCKWVQLTFIFEITIQLIRGLIHFNTCYWSFKRVVCICVTGHVAKLIKLGE